MSIDLSSHIRSVKDFPKPGIVFRDITTLLKNPEAMQAAADQLYEHAAGLHITKVAGIESRGFILGAHLAMRLNAGFVPIRKPGKLPAEKVSETYELEYGTDTIEAHCDAIEEGDVVLIHDDLLATGGTARAACNLVEKMGGKVAQLQFLIELSFLNGRTKFDGYDVRSLIDYTSE